MHDSAGRTDRASAAISRVPTPRRGAAQAPRAWICLLPALLAAAWIAPASARGLKPAPRPIAAPVTGTPAPDFAATARSLDSCCYLNAIATDDLNGDGWQDVVSGLGLGYSFSVLLSTGPGTYADPVVYPVGTPELTRVVLALGDMNGDGHTDVVATGTTPGGLWLYPGDGLGGFGAPRALSLGAASFPQSVAVADLDADGHLDIVTANGETANASVLLGNGDGGFAGTVNFPIAPGPEGMAVGDVDGDGDADIVTAGRQDQALSVLSGDGAGGFSAPTLFAVGRAEPWGVAIADVDGDGHPDLVSSNSGVDGSEFPPIELPGSVSVLRSDGQGGFESPLQIDFEDPGRAHTVAIADLTADGHLDIAVTQTNANVATVLVGDGTGGFDTRLVRPTGQQAGPLTVADVTGDGHPDVVTGNSESISILPSDGAGGIGFPGRFAAGAVPFAVAAVDLDADTHADLLTVNSVDGTVSVRLGDGTRSPATAGTHAVGGNPTSIATGDLNGDGHADAVTADFGGGTVSVLLGDGEGGFAASVAYGVGEGFQSPYAVALGDANGDGRLDVATANTNFENEGITVLLGDGAGGFGAATTYRAGPVRDNTPQGILMSDVTGDGHADIVTANIGSSSLSLLVGDGSGEFAPAQSLTAGVGPVMVATGDVDGDGRADLVSLDHTGQSVSVLTGAGNGQFAAAQTYPICPDRSDLLANPWPWGLALADVDGDGSPDIVTANTQNDTVSVLPNDGTGAFPRYFNFGAGARPGAVAVADIDGDGSADLVTANRENRDVSVLFARNGAGIADLAVDVGATPGNVGPGETMTFEATLANRGPDAAGFPGIGFAFDAELDDLELSTPAGWSCDAPDVGGGATSIACAADALAADAGADFVATASAPASADGDVITMTAAATSTTPDADPGNNSDSVSVSVDAMADLAVAISGPPVFVRGTVATYTIELDNLGPATAPQASLAIRLNVPAHSVVLTAPAGWTCVAQPSAAYVASCTRAGTVPVGDGGSFDVAVTIGNRLFPPRIAVRARAASAAGDPDPSDNTATLTSRLGRAR